MKTIALASFALLAGASAQAHADCTADGKKCTYTTGETAPDAALPDVVNYVLLPSAPITASTKLLLFLPGTGGHPGEYEQFLATAQAAGYVVIGLAYQNTIHSPDLCGYYSKCAGHLYQQSVNGSYWGFFPTENPGFNSVNWRFGQLLAHLDATRPDINWNQFWDFSAAYSTGSADAYVGPKANPTEHHTWGSVNLNGEPAWSRIVIAGHSQGGETAAWITKNKPVLAGITFEAPYATMNTTQGNSSYPANGAPFNVSAAKTPTVTEWGINWGDPSTIVTTTGSVNQNTVLADYLTDWTDAQADRLFITLDTSDIGYHWSLSGTKGDNWPGHWMRGAAANLGTSGKTETFLTSAPSSLATRFNTVNVAPPNNCGGHSATVVDSCVPAGSWLPQYWRLMLDRALTLPPR